MTRRGLTLIETLAATVLLAMLAATGADLLRTARQSHDAASRDATVDPVRLSLVIDALFEDPTRFGLAEDWRPVRSTNRTTQSPDHDWPPIVLSVIETTGVISTSNNDAEPDSQRAGWLIARCADATTTRWLQLPEEPNE